MNTINILFICMGNICRSAAAEAILKKTAEERGVADKYFIDSAGTIGYHCGERADSRMIESAYSRGYRVTSISRQVTPNDFEEFHYIIAMDDNNIEDLKEVADVAARMFGKTENYEKKYNGYVSKMSKLTDYCSKEFLSANGNLTKVPDPYYGGAAGFKLVIDMLENASGNILDNT